MKPDATDIRIIEHLREDGRASLRKLAEDLDLSPSTVSNRFHRLKEEGVIRGFRPVLDYEQLGFGLTAIIEIRVDSARTEEVCSELDSRESVTSMYEVTGETDIVLVCRFIDRKDMNERVKSFQKVDGVESTMTKVVLTTPEEDGELDLEAALET
ncbi:MAG: Lrp/AsnC family transcriptional regulator [Candidatus Nanohaloarchaea archaeon]